MKLYRVLYQKPDGRLVSYTAEPMPLEVAKKYYRNFLSRYFMPDGSPKAYPNGKGFYAFSRPQIVCESN